MTSNSQDTQGINQNMAATGGPVSVNLFTNVLPPVETLGCDIGLKNVVSQKLSIGSSSDNGWRNPTSNQTISHPPLISGESSQTYGSTPREPGSMGASEGLHVSHFNSHTPNIQQTTLLAYEDIVYDNIKRNKLYQRILAVLSDGKPRTRDELKHETNIKENTLRPRIVELIHEGILTVSGYGLSDSGRKAEKLTLW